MCNFSFLQTQRAATHFVFSYLKSSSSRPAEIIGLGTKFHKNLKTYTGERNHLLRISLQTHIILSLCPAHSWWNEWNVYLRTENISILYFEWNLTVACSMRKERNKHGRKQNKKERENLSWDNTTARGGSRGGWFIYFAAGGIWLLLTPTPSIRNVQKMWPVPSSFCKQHFWRQNDKLSSKDAENGTTQKGHKGTASWRVASWRK